MTIHSMKRGSRARRKAMLQAPAQNDSNGHYEGGSGDLNGHSHASLTATSPTAAPGNPDGFAPPAPPTGVGRPSVTAESASRVANGSAPTLAPAARTAVKTGERLAPPPSPLPPSEKPAEAEEADEPREPLLSRLGSNLKGRASRLGSRAAAAGIATWGFLRARTLEDWAWVAVVSLAFVLRIWGIGDKPLHHDESMHAYFSYIFGRDPASYVYNPLLHGPFQFHAVGFTFDVILFLQWIFHVGGPDGNPWINDATARIMPMLFGTAIVALPAGLKRELGRLAALLAALLLAISPAFVYFSRFLREDIYFNFFMFAMVVCAVRFARNRDTRWLVGLFAATVFAYATFEGVFLTLALFVGFLAVFAVWELGYSLAGALPRELHRRERLFFSRAGLLLLLGAIASALALAAMSTIHAVGAFASAHQSQADAQVLTLEHNTVVVLLWVSIAVAVFVIAVLFFQMFYEPSPAAAPAGQAVANADEDEDYYDTTQRPAVRLGDRINARLEAPGAWLARRRTSLDPERQPLLWTLAGVHWVQWFVAVVTAWVLFAALFWVIPGGPGAAAQTWGDGFQLGVGKGIWEGLYYWAQQQDVARGGQPWYYYLLLIPLYEQLAVVFGLAGLVYALRPTRFTLRAAGWLVESLLLYWWAGDKAPSLNLHILLLVQIALSLMFLATTLRPRSRFSLFLVWWFLGSLALYSWAGEKMPWLTIQILLPLMLLAAIALDRVVANARLVLMSRDPAHWEHLPHALARSFVALFGTLAAVLLLLPMVHSMWVLSHQDAADGPHEMMVYVQTTTDVTTVMNKINAADQQMYHGQHALRIAVGQQEEWPFYWYLRDYYLDPHTSPSNPTPTQYATFDPADVTSANVAQPYDVLILLPSDGAQFMANHPTGYTMRQYKLRSWWDEAYKPAPGQLSGPSANWGSGVGVGTYLSYGSNPPPGAGFDLGRATDRVWRWLWLREPLGDTNGSFDFVLIVRNGVPIQQ